MPQLIVEGTGSAAPSGVASFTPDPGGERSGDFLAPPNYSYMADVRGGGVRITPAPGYVIGEAIQISDSRLACSPATPITFVVGGTSYLVGGKDQDVDLIIPGVNAVFRYRGAVLGFVLE
jgi:hypothetical protein